MVLVFGSVYVMDYIYRLAYVEPALHLLDEAYMIMMNKLFGVLLHLVCQYFIKDFCINVHQGYGPELFNVKCNWPKCPNQKTQIGKLD